MLCILPDFHKVDQSVVMGIIEGWEVGRTTLHVTNGGTNRTGKGEEK